MLAVEFCPSIKTYNNAIKSVPGRWPSTGRPCQGAAYGWRYMSKELHAQLDLVRRFQLPGQTKLGTKAEI